MHELAMAEELVGLVKSKAGNRKVLAVDVEVGPFSGAVAEALEFCGRPLLTEAFGAPALFNVRTGEGRLRCACGTEFESADPFAACPACRGFMRTVLKGNDVLLQSIEVE